MKSSRQEEVINSQINNLIRKFKISVSNLESSSKKLGSVEDVNRDILYSVWDSLNGAHSAINNIDSIRAEHLKHRNDSK